MSFLRKLFQQTFVILPSTVWSRVLKTVKLKLHLSCCYPNLMSVWKNFMAHFFLFHHKLPLTGQHHGGVMRERQSWEPILTLWGRGQLTHCTSHVLVVFHCYLFSPVLCGDTIIISRQSPPMTVHGNPESRSLVYVDMCG